jgi:electron transfer flavoprotein beta subunit
MKILVSVKRVPDYEAKIRVATDGKGIVTDGIKWIVNPFDEIAVEEAVRIKEAGKASSVTVVCIDTEDAQQQLRYALAMGADEALLITTQEPVDSYGAARLLREVYKQGDFGLVIMGKQAIDSDRNQTPQMLAALLELPQACFASKVTLEDGHALVEREVDGGIETVKMSLPAVISADLRLNEPRYASLPNIMKAKKKPLELKPAAEYGLDLSTKVTTVKLAPPAPRQGGRKVADVEELVKALQDEAKVL